MPRKVTRRPSPSPNPTALVLARRPRRPTALALALALSLTLALILALTLPPRQGDAPPGLDALKISLELALCDWRRFSEIGLGGWGDGGANHRVQALLTRLDGGSALASEQAYVEAMQREFPV